MSQETIVAVVGSVVGTLGVLLGGLFGQKLVSGWFARGRDHDKAAREQAARDGTARDRASERATSDNEQARAYLSGQLNERDEELRAVSMRERQLLTQLGELAARLARQEERSVAQAVQIEDLKAVVGKWNEDYDEIKAERDAYRRDKHDAQNKLTAASARAQMAERELVARDQEIERLKGQLTALSSKENGA